MSDAITDTIVRFLGSIGLEVRGGPVADGTPLPGITVSEGAIVVDHEKLLYPGDLLHEAGHLAMLPAAVRALPQKLESPGDEMASIAWSYAAALHLGIDPADVFHEHGYRGDSAMILENFGQGHTFGVPMLAWYGLTHERRPNTVAGPDDPPTYPVMQRWLRE